MYIKDNREKISSLTAIDHMVKGGLTYSSGGTIMRIKNNSLEFSYDGVAWKESCMLMNEFLSLKNHWYAQPEFNVREKMSESPDEWVAKFMDLESNTWRYIGFSSEKLQPVCVYLLTDKFDEAVEKNKIMIPTEEQIDTSVPLCLHEQDFMERKRQNK